jgi:hypothetical protein
VGYPKPLHHKILFKNVTFIARKMLALGDSFLFPPIPVSIFSWNKTDVPHKLETLRQASYSALMRDGSKRSTATEIELERYGEDLLFYAQELTNVFELPSKRIVRAYPLCFRWYFPGEAGTGLASMASALPGFEILCALTAAAIMFFRASNASHCDSFSDNMSHRCIETIYLALGKHPVNGDTSTSGIFSLAQWNRLRRQLLPVQLMPGWLKAFTKLVVHSRTFKNALTSSICRPSFFRAAERTASELMICRREAMCLEKMATAPQLASMQRDYDQSHEHWAQLLCEGATTDSEAALEDDSTHPYVNGLLKIAQWANTSLCESHAGPALTERWRCIASINSASCVEHVNDIDVVMQWRLESLPFAKSFN